MLSALTDLLGFITPGMAGMLSQACQLMLPLMGAAFLAGTFFRVLMFLSVKGQSKFVLSFEKQVKKVGAESPAMVNPFHISAKETLDSAFQGAFGKKSMVTRLLLVREGSSRLIKETIKHLENHKETEPAFYEISKTVFAKNNIFNRVLGVAPMGPLNGLLNAFPGLFICFGMMAALLAMLGAMPAFLGATGSLTAAQTGIARFMDAMAFGLNLSLVAGGLSLAMIVMNFMMAPERMYVRTVDRFANTLEELMKFSSNRGPSEIAVRRSPPAPAAQEFSDEEETHVGAIPQSPAHAEADAEAGESEGFAPPPPHMSAEDIVADLASQGEEKDEDSQVTKIEEVQLDHEELRKLQMYHHPEEAAQVEAEPLAVIREAEPAPAEANLEEIPDLTPSQSELSEIDKALWGTVKLDEEVSQVEWTAQTEEDSGKSGEAEDILEEDRPAKPPKAA